MTVETADNTAENPIQLAVGVSVRLVWYGGILAGCNTLLQ